MGIDLSKGLLNTRLAGTLTRAFDQVGLCVTRSVNTLQKRRAIALRRLRPSVVLDIGANVGQYAANLRAQGYEGRIISFEPEPQTFRILKANSAREGEKHVCLQLGLGATDGEIEFGVRLDSTCGSFRRSQRDGELKTSAFEIERKVVVPISRLDSVAPGIALPNERFYIKIDTQGYEREVLLGATETLKRADAVEVELSLTALYEDQALLPEVWRMLSNAGFRPAWIERGYRDPEDVWLFQVDGLFIREHSWRDATSRR